MSKERLVLPAVGTLYSSLHCTCILRPSTQLNTSCGRRHGLTISSLASGLGNPASDSGQGDVFRTEHLTPAVSLPLTSIN